MIYEIKVNEQELKSRPSDFKLLQFLFMKQVKQSKGLFSGEIHVSTLPRLEMIDVNSTILDIKKHFYNKIKHIYKPDNSIHTGDSEINRCLVFHVYDNLPYYTESKHSKRKSLCEFCKASHGGTMDTCDMRVGDVSVNSEEGCR